MESEHKTAEAEYEPFGPEWEKEMMKFNKAFLINFAGNVCKENLSSQSQTQLLRDEVIELRDENEKFRDLLIQTKYVLRGDKSVYDDSELADEIVSALNL